MPDSKPKYFLVNADFLPEVYSKVIEAKKLLASGDAVSATQAAKMAQLSRSAYYKYKDGVFEYNSEVSKDMVTLTMKLEDTKGVLSAITNELYMVGANVLSINQEIPQHGIADVTLTMFVADMTVDVSVLINKLKTVSGVKSIQTVN